MKWRYGIVKYKHIFAPYTFYGIGELYFENDPNNISACSEKPIDILAEIDEENPSKCLQETLTRMLNDIKLFPNPFDIDGPYEKD